MNSVSWNSGSLQSSSIAAGSKVAQQQARERKCCGDALLLNLWTSAENPYKSAELRRTCCDVEFRRKKQSAEILGKIIESAEVHYTFCDVELRRTIGLNTKFRRKQFFQQKSGTQFV